MANNPHLGDTSANAAVNAITALCNSGFLQIYDGSQPANCNTAVGVQTLLAKLTFGNPAFGAAAAGVATANAIGSATASATSTATWFRVFKSDDTTAVFDGSVGTSGCDLNLNSTAISSGATVSVSSLTFTLPE